MFWREGKIYCGACEKKLVTKKNLVQHIVGLQHLKNVPIQDAAEARHLVLIPEAHRAAREEQIIGQTFSGELKVH